MSITRSESPDKLDVSSIDNEHRIQIGLLNALYESVNDKNPASEINQIRQSIDHLLRTPLYVRRATHAHVRLSRL